MLHGNRSRLILFDFREHKRMGGNDRVIDLYENSLLCRSLLKWSGPPHEIVSFPSLEDSEAR